MQPQNPLCPICEATGSHSFTLQYAYQVWKCRNCGSQYLYPQPTDEILATIYNEDYFLGGDSIAARQTRSELKRATAKKVLKQLQRYGINDGAHILEIGCGQGEFLVEAVKAGYQVTGIEFSEHAAQIAQNHLPDSTIIVGEIETASLEENHYDIVLSIDVIEHVRNPIEHVNAIQRVLRQDSGVIALGTLSLNTWTAWLMRRYWMEYKVEHLLYFTNNGLNILLETHSFKQIRLEPLFKMLTPRYVVDHFIRYPVPVATPIMRILNYIIPESVMQQWLSLHGSGIIVFGRLISKNLD